MEKKNALLAALLAYFTAGTESAETDRIPIETTLLSDERCCQADWEFDDEWTRFEFSSSGSKLACSSKLQNSKQTDSDCRLLNPNVLAWSPLTKTDQRKLTFIGFS